MYRRLELMGNTRFRLLRNEPALQPARIITCSRKNHIGHRDQYEATMSFLSWKPPVDALPYTAKKSVNLQGDHSAILSLYSTVTLHGKSTVFFMLIYKFLLCSTFIVPFTPSQYVWPNRTRAIFSNAMAPSATSVTAWIRDRDAARLSIRDRGGERRRLLSE